MNKSRIKIFFFNGRKHYVYRNESGHIVLDDDDIHYHATALQAAAREALSGK